MYNNYYYTLNTQDVFFIVDLGCSNVIRYEKTLDTYVALVSCIDMRMVSYYSLSAMTGSYSLTNGKGALATTHPPNPPLLLELLTVITCRLQLIKYKTSI